MSKSRLKRLTDLFADGRAVPLPDGSYLWVQVLNAFERDECLSDAQVARARLVLALKAKGDERMKVEARLLEHGADALIDELASVKLDMRVTDIFGELQSDPEWKERLNIIMRNDPEQAARPQTPEEEALVEKINDEVMAEFRKRQDDERDYQRRHFSRMSRDELIDSYVDAWLDRRGSELATAEYALTEMWFATRFCDATGELDALDHSACEGHRDRVFETKADARSAPDRLQAAIQEALRALAMEGTDPKDSGSATSSSDSSHQPSAAEESTPSTSTETPATLPGI